LTTEISPYKGINSQVEISEIPKVSSSLIWVIKVLFKILQKSVSNNYRAIIMSGGPFEIFLISPILRALGFKTILDFRDPFANNKRFQDNWLRNIGKRALERIFILSSSKIITVNNSLARKLNSKKKVSVIPNGFANYKNITLGKVERNTFYTNGQIYCGTNELWSSIKQVNPQAKMFYQGDKGLNFFPNSKDDVFFLPPMQHQKVLEEASRFEIMILFGCNNNEVSYTKIYDFLFLKKKIIVFNDAKAENSELKNLLREYPLTLFLYPNEIDLNRLRKFLTLDNDTGVYNTSQFNRIHGGEAIKRILES
tara:strand:- start:9336 stop:10265 length:930 start_codon:yes stop_codon:yes gene_type:complete